MDVNAAARHEPLLRYLLGHDLFRFRSILLHIMESTDPDRPLTSSHSWLFGFDPIRWETSTRVKTSLWSL